MLGVFLLHISYSSRPGSRTSSQLLGKYLALCSKFIKLMRTANSVSGRLGGEPSPPTVTGGDLSQPPAAVLPVVCIPHPVPAYLRFLFGPAPARPRWRVRASCCCRSNEPVPSRDKAPQELCKT